MFFPPELRTLPLIRGKAPHLIDLMPYRWLAYFGDVDLESLLLTVKAHSAGDYEESLQFINQALDNQHKEIAGFGPNGMIVRGKTEFGRTTSITSISSLPAKNRCWFSSAS